MDLGLRVFFLQRECEAVCSICIGVFLLGLLFHLHIFTDFTNFEKINFDNFINKHNQVEPTYN